MYTNFAYIYDELTNDIDYSRWADYIEKLFKRYRVKPSLILDLGCGTGSFAVEMASRGYEMIGIDSSPDMLACARNKSESKNLDVLFINQDMVDFELYGTVDAVVCLLDSINYVTSKRDVTRVFKLVRNYLNPGGLFIFDINTPYKFEHVLSENVFYEVRDDLAFIWENRYDKRRKLCEFDLTFFIKRGEYFQRHDEIHVERAYSLDEIGEMAERAGLKLKGMFDDLSMRPPIEKSKRVFFVCSNK